ncbi:MAG: hypothetical protein GYA50_00180 [Eubacteriaceae bacterium]|nr:hypothetical protein [Eubacteriaceae bacterium]
MTMNKTKEPSAITYAFIANILYFFICAIYCSINSQNQVLNISFLSLCVILWFIIGNVYSRKLKKTDLKKYLLFVFISFIPILIFLITYNILINVSVNSQTYNWILYYSIGAPIIFWIKPAAFLINFFNLDFYLFAYSIVAAFMFICLIGMLSSSKRHKVKKAEMFKYDRDELIGFNAEAAVTSENETNCQDIKNNTLEYDDSTEQVTFDALKTNESKNTSDNMDLKQEPDINEEIVK